MHLLWRKTNRIQKILPIWTCIKTQTHSYNSTLHQRWFTIQTHRPPHITSPPVLSRRNHFWNPWQHKLAWRRHCQIFPANNRSSHPNKQCNKRARARWQNRLRKRKNYHLPKRYRFSLTKTKNENKIFISKVIFPLKKKRFKGVKTEFLKKQKWFHNTILSCIKLKKDSTY